PTEMGIKMAEALQEFAPRIASPEMTAELEKDMDMISMRDLTKEEVVAISRDLLRQAYGSLEQNREQISAKIYEGITDDRILGVCPKCGKNKLRVIRSKATKKRFVGCEGYPDCDQTYPLPQRGDIIGMDEVCPQCGSPKIKILGGRRPWILCLDPYCPTKEEYRKKQEARAERIAGGKTTGPKTGGSKTTSTKRKSVTKTATKTAKKTATNTGTKRATKTAAKTTSRRTAGAEAREPEEAPV
ncbi:MAG: topoisomerase DNA-binding C4 zinc finger domain-containing protein, partial [Thermoleophilia bacterium]|nr:topoisomerase DNA-binding C4 zinc finger domain-containing protein [Thermoleophilia bacterium]